ncbi:MAG: hypothetical protein NZ742_11440 [Acidobacteria bacterium]|nr:hypothetical protein [Acidobacteriota bacterium]MDW7985299.1 chemotaxis protein CheW [Acidobacteriota bacterium]
MKCLRFRVADYVLAVDLAWVHRVVSVRDVTTLPTLYVWGGTRWLRVDLLGPTSEVGETVVLLASQDARLGWQVGRVDGIDEVSESELHPIPRGWLNRGISWVTHLYFRDEVPAYIVHLPTILQVWMSQFPTEASP